MSSIVDRARKAWDVFRGREPTYRANLGPSYSRRPDKSIVHYGGEKLNMLKRMLTASFKRQWIQILMIA